jgi:hypothetical protein
VTWPLHWVESVAVATTVLSRPATAIGVKSFTQPVLPGALSTQPPLTQFGQ